MSKPHWILYSPAPVSEQLPASESVRPIEAESATSSWHEGGFFLPTAEFQGWRFGLLQEHLHVAGVQAFVRSPLGVEATIVSDPHAKGIERLAVPTELPSYAGAFRVELPQPLSSIANITVGFQQMLPLIKQLINESGTPHA